MTLAIECILKFPRNIKYVLLLSFEKYGHSQNCLHVSLIFNPLLR